MLYIDVTAAISLNIFRNTPSKIVKNRRTKQRGANATFMWKDKDQVFKIDITKLQFQSFDWRNPSVWNCVGPTVARRSTLFHSKIEARPIETAQTSTIRCTTDSRHHLQQSCFVLKAFFHHRKNKFFKADAIKNLNHQFALEAKNRLLIPTSI